MYLVIYKSFSLAAPLLVTKYTTDISMNLLHFVVLPKYDLTEAGLLNKISFLAPPLGATKFILKLVTHCYTSFSLAAPLLVTKCITNISMNLLHFDVLPKSDFNV